MLAQFETAYVTVEHFCERALVDTALQGTAAVWGGAHASVWQRTKRLPPATGQRATVLQPLRLLP